MDETLIRRVIKYYRRKERRQRERERGGRRRRRRTIQLPRRVRRFSNQGGTAEYSRPENTFGEIINQNINIRVIVCERVCSSGFNGLGVETIIEKLHERETDRS